MAEIMLVPSNQTSRQVDGSNEKASDKAFKEMEKGTLADSLMTRKLVERMKPEEREALLLIFDDFDKDHSGYLSQKEVVLVLHELEIFSTPEAEQQCVQEWFSQVDKDKDCRLHKDEFLGMMAVGMKSGLTEKELRDAFSVFDADRSGTVNSAELKDALSGLGPMVLSTKELDELMDLLDTNNSGTLEVQEFLAAFLKADDHEHAKSKSPRNRPLSGQSLHAWPPSSDSPLPKPNA